jgi:hypothetical protein
VHRHRPVHPLLLLSIAFRHRPSHVLPTITVSLSRSST